MPDHLSPASSPNAPPAPSAGPAPAVQPRPDARGPIFVVLNACSGKDNGEDTRNVIAGVLREAGREHHIHQVENGADLPAAARQAVDAARRVGGVVVAAGGDGTLNTVAQAVLGSGCAFGVLPQGTFNYFGRVNGISADTDEATRGLLDGQVEPVQVGLVNDKAFLVNASLGLYPRLLEDREAYKREYGRSRGVAFMAAMVTLCTAHRPLKLQLSGGGEDHANGGGQDRHVRTPTLFVANNQLQMEQVGVQIDEGKGATLKQGTLVAITLEPVSTLRLFWLMLRGAAGQLGEARDVSSFGFQRLVVTPAAPRGRSLLKVATDGEINWLRAPLVFGVSPEPLWLLKPAVRQALAADDDGQLAIAAAAAKRALWAERA